MATYRQIQAEVEARSGFVPKTCWIAHILSDHGLSKRTAPNRIDPKARTQPCPIERRASIEAALSRFGMI